MFEGQVIELTPVESENPLAGYGKTISHIIIGLKTTKGTKQLKLDPSIYESIQKEKVHAVCMRVTDRQLSTLLSIASQVTLGDVIYIEANSGAVKVQLSFVARTGFVFDRWCFSFPRSVSDGVMFLHPSLIWRLVIFRCRFLFPALTRIRLAHSNRAI